MTVLDVVNTVVWERELVLVDRTGAELEVDEVLL